MRIVSCLVRSDTAVARTTDAHVYLNFGRPPADVFRLGSIMSETDSPTPKIQRRAEAGDCHRNCYQRLANWRTRSHSGAQANRAGFQPCVREIGPFAKAPRNF
jgi:hypothetical protein